VGFSKRVPTCDQRYGFLVVHGHSAKRFTDVDRSRKRIGLAIGSFRIHIDQSHLNGG
jgi:hypothetical protein